MSERLPGERWALATVMQQCFPKLTWEQSAALALRISNLLAVHHVYLQIGSNHPSMRRFVDPLDGMAEMFRMYEESGREPWFPDGEKIHHHR